MITVVGGGIYLDVHVQPGARRSGVVGVHGDRLKVAVTEPAEDGRANRAVVAEVADFLCVKPSRVTVSSGSTSRRKRLFIEDGDAAAIEAIIGRMAQPPEETRST